jgi:acetyl esterase/lipase
MQLSGKRIRRTLIRVLTVVCLVLLAARAMSAISLQKNLKQGGYLVQWDTDDGKILTGLPYGKAKTNRYDLYIPKDIDPKTETPLLLFIHGGSWTSGSRSDMAYACKYYCKKGCITATMDYSLISEQNRDITIRTMLDEITTCISDLKKQLKKSGYHASGLAIGGTSAGGHLALLYAYSRAEESAIPIAFVFEKVGPVSVRKEFWGEDISAMLIGRGARVKVDAKKLDAPEAVKAADSLSPLHFISPGSPPTIFAYGGKDDLVRPVHRDELARALKKHQVPNIRVDFPNSNHAIWDDPESTESFREAVLQYCEQYMKKSRDAQ